MMRPPELEIALILNESFIQPRQILDSFIAAGGALNAETLGKSFPTLDRMKIMGILSVLHRAGAVELLTDDVTVPLTFRNWKMSGGKMNILISNATSISNAIPFLKSLYGSADTYSIAATVPDALTYLEKYYAIFENTALGMRRLVESAMSELQVMVPFMDETGFGNISESIENAIRRGVRVSFISRDLSEGGKNRVALSRLIPICLECSGNLYLFEARHEPEAPISHAKILSRDGGSEIYIGSANLTRSSMETTIEMGVFLRGSGARPLHDFLGDIIKNSTKVWP